MNRGSLAPEALNFTAMLYITVESVAFAEIQITAMDKGNQRKVRSPEYEIERMGHFGKWKKQAMAWVAMIGAPRNRQLCSRRRLEVLGVLPFVSPSLVPESGVLSLDNLLRLGGYRPLCVCMCVRVCVSHKLKPLALFLHCSVSLVSEGDISGP